jgi:hypothetical protein
MKTFLPEKYVNAPSKEAASPTVQDGNFNNASPTYNKGVSASSEDTRAKVERVVACIEQKHVDITESYEAWVKVGFALSSEFNESGRGFFHRVSMQSPKYKQGEADRQYNKCLAGKGNGVTIATFFKMAADAGADISNGKIQNQGNGSLDFWISGSRDKQTLPQNAVSSPDNATQEIQKSKSPKIQSDEIGSRWVLDEEELPHFPQSMFNSLPSFLKEVLGNCVSEDDRDMMLMGSLTCISSTLHNVVGEYNMDDWYPMMYFFVMADAGMGKGSLKYCRQLVAPIHQELLENSERQISDYKAMVKEAKRSKGGSESDASSVLGEEPHRKTLFIPTNSSAAAVIQQLDDNGGIGLIFDTECDTLSAILKSDYGDYSTIIRKSYHHEPIDLNRRKDDEYRVIETPKLAICLSGTPGQLYTLTPQAEDGTFSRITCYHVPFKMEFRNVLAEHSANGQGRTSSFGGRPNAGVGSSLRDRFRQLGVKYKRMYEAFFRGGSYRVVIPQLFCNEFNEHFRAMNQETVEDISHDMQSVVRRLAFSMFRVMMVLTAIRFMDEQPNPSALANKDGSPILLTCWREDFDTAMAMADVLIYHTVYCYAHLPQSKVTTDGSGRILSKKDKMNRLYAALPDTFDKPLYVDTAQKMGYSPSTASKWINAFIAEGRLERKGQNCYAKVASDASREATTG